MTPVLPGHVAERLCVRALIPSQQSRRTAFSSIEQAPAEASHTGAASHGMEISTRKVCYSQCCAQHAGWDGWHAKLKLLQAAAGGEPAEQKNLAGLLSHLWDEQTNRPDRNRRAPPCAQLAHPARPAWGEPKRARRSVPTQPPTWASPGHLHACSACLLVLVPAFLRPSKTGRQGGVTPGGAGTVLYLLWYYHLLLQAVGTVGAVL